MDCREFQKHFSAFLDSELAPGLRGRAETHLDGCGRCSRLVQAHRTGVGQLARLPVIAPPANLYENVMRAVRPSFAKPQPVRTVSLWRPWVLVPAIATAAVVLAFGLFFNFDSRRAPELQTFAMVDSTMDMINFQVAEQLAGKENSRKLKDVSLASYARTEEETALHNGVNRNPVLVLSGVTDQGE